MPASGSTLWQTSGGDNSRRGLFRGSVRIDPKPVRRLAAHGAVQASVVFDPNGKAFVADMAGWVQAFSADGQPLWRTPLEGGVSATPVVDPDGDRVFAGTHAGWVCALKAANGELSWRRELPTKSDPRILSDLLYLPKQKAVVVSSWGGRFYALDAAGGETRYSWDAGISPYAGAAADGSEAVYCLRAVSGQGVQFVRVSPGGMESVLYRPLEEEKAANRLLVAAAPVLDTERSVVYFITNTVREGHLHAWSLQANTMTWSRQFRRCLAATPAIMNDGGVVVADLTGFVHALAPEGSPRYRYASGSEYLLAGGVCDQGGVTFVGDSLGVIHTISPSGLGKPMFEAKRGIQARSSFDRLGNLYVPSTDRQVYVFANQMKA